MAHLTKGILTVPQGKIQNLVGYRRNSVDVLQSCKPKGSIIKSTTMIDQASRMKAINLQYDFYSKGIEKILSTFNFPDYVTRDYLTKLNFTKVNLDYPDVLFNFVIPTRLAKDRIDSFGIHLPDIYRIGAVVSGLASGVTSGLFSNYSFLNYRSNSNSLSYNVKSIIYNRYSTNISYNAIYYPEYVLRGWRVYSLTNPDVYYVVVSGAFNSVP
jgi:hypothetical protein